VDVVKLVAVMGRLNFAVICGPPDPAIVLTFVAWSPGDALVKSAPLIVVNVQL
jgi:hypothetical protein